MRKARAASIRGAVFNAFISGTNNLCYRPCIALPVLLLPFHTGYHTCLYESLSTGWDFPPLSRWYCVRTPKMAEIGKDLYQGYDVLRMDRIIGVFRGSPSYSYDFASSLDSTLVAGLHASMRLANSPTGSNPRRTSSLPPYSQPPSIRSFRQRTLGSGPRAL